MQLQTNSKSNIISNTLIQNIVNISNISVYNTPQTILHSNNKILKASYSNVICTMYDTSDNQIGSFTLDNYSLTIWNNQKQVIRWNGTTYNNVNKIICNSTANRYVNIIEVN